VVVVVVVEGRGDLESKNAGVYLESINVRGIFRLGASPALCPAADYCSVTLSQRHPGVPSLFLY
jgi:hypothetical protein